MAATKTSGPRKLSEITEPPKPSDAQLAAAKKLGVDIKVLDPNVMRGMLDGHRTLSELHGIPKVTLFEWARNGQDLLDKGQLEKAAEIFLGLIALDPYEGFFHTGLGVALLRNDKLDEAAVHLNRSLDINPFSIDARASRAELNALLGKKREALEDLVRLVQDNPDATDPAVQKARVLVNAGMKTGGKPAAGKAAPAKSPGPKAPVGKPTASKSSTGKHPAAKSATAGKGKKSP